MLEALSAAIKTLLYAGLLSCAGAVFADTMLRNEYLASITSRVTRTSALVAIAASLVSALILFFRLGGQFDNATFAAVFASSAGAATCMQVVGAGLLLASLNDKSARGMRFSNAALMMLSFAFSGHAAAIDLGDGLVAFVHASVAACWIGSLWILRATCKQMHARVVTDVVLCFSYVATWLIGGLVFAGLALIFILVDFEQLPTLTDYEQVLALKLGVVALVLGVASYNKFRLTPRLITNDASAVKSLRRMIDIELVLIGAILAVTAILTTYTSPHD